MSNRILHDMDAAWTSSNAAVLQVFLDNQSPFVVEGTASNRLEAQSGSLNATAGVLFAPPLDLGSFDEIRFWLMSNRRASGSPASPFHLEFSYTDTGDLPGEQHRWLVPVNQAGKWEHRRIGIEQDRRTSIDRIQLRCLTDLPFVCRIDELLAVQEDMLGDLEQACADRVSGMTVPGLTAVPLDQIGNPGDLQIVLPPSPGFQAGNLVLVADGLGPDELRSVTAVVHQATDSTLTLAAPLAGTFPALVATASLLIPPVVLQPPIPPATPSPSILVMPMEVTEDLDRTTYVDQRDSFRLRGGRMVCSVRPAARAYAAQYQVAVRAPLRSQQLLLHTELLRRLTIQRSLRINGVPSPVAILHAPVLDNLDGRDLVGLSPTYVRIGTRLETAPRAEVPWVQQAEARAARMDAPLDQEGIVIRL